ncbi:MAG: hypothetical protein WCJ33_07405 [Pseudomonadota bacterium]
MDNIKNEMLASLAKKYIWWQTPEESIAIPYRIIAQVMDIGDYDDVIMLTEEFGEDVLKQTLNYAEIGQLNERSWIYWHHRLDMLDNGVVPNMPARFKE